MGKLKEADRSATIAWSPTPQNPNLLAAGTVAGHMDHTFQSTAQLELFSLNLSEQDDQMPVLGSAAVKYRFHRLAWGTATASDDFPYGILAGGLDNGALCVWNPAAILDPSLGDPVLAHAEHHSGPVRGLDFNPHQPNLLASGSNNSEIFMWDLAAPGTPKVFSFAAKNKSQTGPLDISCVSWNRKVAHIMASTSSSGMSTVWDVKEKRAAISFTDPDKPLKYKAIAWSPEVSTQIITASDDDKRPVMQLWDLRNAYQPVMEMSGHDRGILSVSWCPNDSGLLLTCGKDNRTLCWNPNTGEILCELPQSSNWNFDVQWSPKIPAVLCTCSFESKLAVYSLQDVHTSKTNNVEGLGDISSAGGESKAVINAPRWLQRPVGATFGFGGRLVSFSNGGIDDDAKSSSSSSSSSNSSAGKGKTATPTPSLHVYKLNQENDLLKQSEALEQTMFDETFVQFCDEKQAAAKDPQDAQMWKLLGVLFKNDSREQLLDYFDLDLDDLLDEVRDFTNDRLPEDQRPKASAEAGAADAADIGNDDAAEAEAEAEAAAGEGEDGDDDAAKDSPVQAADPMELFGGSSAGDDEGFAINAEPQTEQSEPEPQEVAVTNEDEAEAEPESPFFPAKPFAAQQDASVDKMLWNAAKTGDFEAVVRTCFATGNYADAIMFASMNRELWSKTQATYLNLRREAKHVQLLQALMQKDISPVVESSDLAEWKETLGVIITFAQKDQFQRFCQILAERLVNEAGDTNAAMLCFMCAADMERLGQMWLDEFNTRTAKGQETNEALQELVERMVIFQKSVDSRSPPSVMTQVYNRYAQVLAAQGALETSLRYLQLAGENERPGEGDDSLLELKHRLFFALQGRVDMAPPPLPYKTVFVGTQSQQAAKMQAAEAQRQQQQAAQQAQQAQQQAQQQVQQQGGQQKANPYSSGPIDTSRYENNAGTPQGMNSMAAQQAARQAAEARRAQEAAAAAQQQQQQQQQQQFYNPNAMYNPNSNNTVNQGTPYVPSNTNNANNGNVNTNTNNMMGNTGNMEFFNPKEAQKNNSNSSGSGNSSGSSSSMGGNAQNAGGMQGGNTGGQMSSSGNAGKQKQVEEQKVQAEPTEEQKALVAGFSAVLETIQAQNLATAQNKQAADVSKRLENLLAKLANGEVPDQAVAALPQLAGALQSRNYDAAAKLQKDLAKTYFKEIGHELTGLKTLLSLAKRLKI